MLHYIQKVSMIGSEFSLKYVSSECYWQWSNWMKPNTETEEWITDENVTVLKALAVHSQLPSPCLKCCFSSSIGNVSLELECRKILQVPKTQPCLYREDFSSSKWAQVNTFLVSRVRCWQSTGLQKAQSQVNPVDGCSHGAGDMNI